MTDTLHHYINGERVAGESGRFGDVFNPATGEVSARVPMASAAEMRKAVEAAKAALPGWAATTPITRARVMFAFVFGLGILWGIIGPIVRGLTSIAIGD